MKKFLLSAATGALALAAASVTAPSQAALLNAPVPTNAYITLGGLNWAWAAPLDFNSVDLSYQSQFGWRLPTAQELLNAPSALDFLFAGANTPATGSDPVSGANWQFTSATLTGPAALAAPYFSFYRHGDWGNGPGSAGANVVPWAGQPGAQGFSESLVVRVASGVPEPSTWAMMLIGFAGLALTFSRKARREAAAA
ncbi:MAG: PEP-CTERM sorting domain-containing protein [Methylobacteriaceae bacterium]|nr:PEP-CTERM sorting domain-containing protein [Methylobacteriaceae bacterium]